MQDKTPEKRVKKREIGSNMRETGQEKNISVEGTNDQILLKEKKGK